MSQSQHMYIGKIPAYNSRINDTTIQYEKRLLNNLTITKFQPIGYKINLDMNFSTIYDELKSITGDSLENISDLWRGRDQDKEMDKIDEEFRKLNAGEFDKNYVEKKRLNFDLSAPLYKLGQSLGVAKNDMRNKAATQTYTALTAWQEMQKQTFRSEGWNAVDSFSIIATTDSTINETISNEYQSNQINNIPTMLGAKAQAAFDAVLGTANLIKGTVASIDSQALMELLKTKGDKIDNQFLNIISAQALGIQTSLPRIWKQTDYNNTSSFTIKLVSPSGYPEDVKLYILKPLQVLTLACSPLTFDGASFGFPPIWKVETKGLGTMNLAGITAMTISRGGQDTMFNRFNQPVNVDVRIVVEPLVQGFATPMDPGINFRVDVTKDNEIHQLVASPNSIFDSMRYGSANDTTSRFVLDTLHL